MSGCLQKWQFTPSSSPVSTHASCRTIFVLTYPVLNSFGEFSSSVDRKHRSGTPYLKLSSPCGCLLPKSAFALYLISSDPRIPPSTYAPVSAQLIFIITPCCLTSCPIYVPGVPDVQICIQGDLDRSEALFVHLLGPIQLSPHV